MGGTKSRARPSPPPSSPRRPPQREQPQHYKDLEFVKSYRPENTDTKHLRILLHGPVGDGKSSFINSVDSVLQGRVTGRALTDATSGGTSFTLKYKTYKFRKPSGAFYSFVFNDIMGIEKNTDNGVHLEDVKLALRGHVKDGYKFTPGCPLTESDQGYNSRPTLEDRVHVLVCVVPAGLVSLQDDEVVIRLAASEMGIPQLAILTKVDDACPEVKNDIKNIYKSKYLKDKVEQFHKTLGIPLNCIFLVKNYSSEKNINGDTDALILSALRQMVSYGEDFLNDQ